MTNDVFVLTRIIEREGNCIGIDCESCPLGSYQKGFGYGCSSTNDPGTYVLAKEKLMKLDPSLLFEVLL